jgi:hypothetical protein
MEADRFHNTIEVSTAICILKFVNISVYVGNENIRNRMTISFTIHMRCI